MNLRSMMTGIALGATSLCALAQDTMSAYKIDAPDIRAYFQIFDSEGAPTRAILANTNKIYTLEIWAETLSQEHAAIQGVDWHTSLANAYSPFNNPSDLTHRPIYFEKQHYGTNDFFYPLAMSKLSNSVDSSGLSRRTTTNSLPRPAVTDARKGILGRYTLAFSNAESITNAEVRTIYFRTFDGFNGGSPVRNSATRSLRVATMPENYAGTMLVPDINDGQTPANDFKKDRLGRNIITNDARIDFEPFCAVGPKAPGNYVLQRSTNIIGPWTSVQTYSPRSAGSFNDREAYTNSWKNVFYRLMNESSLGILTNQSSVQSVAAKPSEH